MQKKTHLSNTLCPMARSLDRVGEQWTMLILRDAFYGATRFDQFQKGLGIASNMLARRLNTLVAEGLFERRQYSAHPPRYDYLLTARGHDFRPVLLTLLAWGSKHFSPEGTMLELVDQSTGAVADPVLVDRVTGKTINEAEHVCVAGPAASEGMKRRLARRTAPATTA
jgi:DNA-binding HxlR family transcriptional regulator